MSSGSAVPPTTVLVVEDELLLRMRAVDIVEDAGFIPVEAVNADEALSILESRSDISLLFTDIQMPGSIDGLKLAHAVHKRWPEIKIILVSGQVNLLDTDKPANSRFFGKPPGSEADDRRTAGDGGHGRTSRSFRDAIVLDAVSGAAKQKSEAILLPSCYARKFDGRERQPSRIA